MLTKLYARPSIYKPVVKFNFDLGPTSVDEVYMLVEKRHLVLSGPWSRQVHPWSSLVYSQTSSCSVTNRIFFITLAPPQVHFGLAATCSSVRAPLAFAGSVGRSIQQATAAESSAGAAGLLLRRSCGQPAEQQRRRSICCIVPYPSNVCW